MSFFVVLSWFSF